MEHRAWRLPFDQHLQRVDEAGQRQSAPAASSRAEVPAPSPQAAMGTVLPHRRDGVSLKPVLTEQVQDFTPCRGSPVACSKISMSPFMGFFR